MTLAQTLIVKLGAIAGVIGWTAATPQLVAVVDQATELAGSNDAALMPIATWLMWQAVLVELAVQVDFSADKASYKLSQMYDAVEGFAASSYALAAPFLPADFGGAVFGALKTNPRPYAPITPGGEFAS